MTSDARNILALYGVPGVGAKTFARLVRRFGSAEAVFSAGADALMTMEGVGPVLAESIRSFDREVFLKEQERLMERAGAVMITRSDESYPPLLNKFASAPPVLFVRGDTACLTGTTIAFVGTRRLSAYGAKMTRKLAAEAVNAGACVVSGMADGIDTIAHRTALDEGGTTVAVFGCGIDVIYPTKNRKLARDIAESGCLVSHFPMGTPGAPGNFPARNSVIVGLSLGTIVVEAPKRSGALITADLTLKAGRPLFTVPGPADSPKSEGTNELLGRGAHPVSAIDIVMKEIGKPLTGTVGKKTERPLPKGLAGDILKALESEPVHIEKLCMRLDLPSSKVLSELTMLEIDGYVHQLPGKFFELR